MATEAEQLVLIKRLLGRTMAVLMKNDFANAQSPEHYVVEVDGQAKAEYGIFCESAGCWNAAKARVSKQRCQIA